MVLVERPFGKRGIAKLYENIYKCFVKNTEKSIVIYALYSNFLTHGFIISKKDDILYWSFNKNYDIKRHSLKIDPQNVGDVWMLYHTINIHQ